MFDYIDSLVSQIKQILIQQIARLPIASICMKVNWISLCLLNKLKSISSKRFLLFVISYSFDVLSSKVIFAEFYTHFEHKTQTNRYELYYYIGFIPVPHLPHSTFEWFCSLYSFRLFHFPIMLSPFAAHYPITHCVPLLWVWINVFVWH